MYKVFAIAGSDIPDCPNSRLTQPGIEPQVPSRGKRESVYVPPLQQCERVYGECFHPLQSGMRSPACS